MTLKTRSVGVPILRQRSKHFSSPTLERTRSQQDEQQRRKPEQGEGEQQQQTPPLPVQGEATDEEPSTREDLPPKENFLVGNLTNIKVLTAGKHDLVHSSEQQHVESGVSTGKGEQAVQPPLKSYAATKIRKPSSPPSSARCYPEGEYSSIVSI